MAPSSRRFAVGGAVLAALVLAACGDHDPPECDTAPSPPTADTTMAFLVDGRPVALDTAGWSPGFVQDSSSGDAYLSAWSGTLASYDWLAIQLSKFHGAGAYPVRTSWSESPYASITYGCSAVAGELWTGEEPVPDTVYVTAYDSASAQIEGTYSARVKGYRHGEVVHLADGSFKGRLLRY